MLLLELLLLLTAQLLPLLLLLEGDHRRRLLLLRLAPRRPRWMGRRRHQPPVPVPKGGVYEAGVGVCLLLSPPRPPLLVAGGHDTTKRAMLSVAGRTRVAGRINLRKNKRGQTKT